MTGTGPDQHPQRYVLRAVAPIRVLAVSSVCVLVGAVLLVVWRALTLSVLVAALGGILLAFGAALYVAALVSVRRLAQNVELGRVGVTLKGRTVAWSAIKEVRLDGPRLSLVTHPGRERPMEVVNPGGPSDQTFAELTDAIRTNLDSDRGYRPSI